MNACCCDGAQERCRELEAQLAELNLDLEVRLCSNPRETENRVAVAKATQLTLLVCCAPQAHGTATHTQPHTPAVTQHTPAVLRAGAHVGDGARRGRRSCLCRGEAAAAAGIRGEAGGSGRPAAADEAAGKTATDCSRASLILSKMPAKHVACRQSVWRLPLRLHRHSIEWLCP